METALNRVVLVGDHLPRQCGIATFTTDLADALASNLTESEVMVMAVNDRREGYVYPPRVRFEFAEKDLASYRRVADFLNINRIDVVSVQHEYGIYGGPAGSHILALLKQLRMPIVTTLHTVLKDPTPAQKKVLKELAEVSDRLVVMAHRSIEFLTEIYDVPEEKIDFIHHGIPDVPFVDPNFHKDLFAVEGKTVMLTFGLLSPNKGIENVIEALPKIIENHPEVVYLVQGATHPHLLKTEGESYRLKLQRLVKTKGVESHVVFHNRFVSLEELIEFISAADLYILPYLNLSQMVSGTLAYALGAGKAVISTPIWYAEEVLAEGRGVIVSPEDPDALANQVIHLLDQEGDRHAMRRRAYEYGRDMVWSKVSQEYVRSFSLAIKERSETPRITNIGPTVGQPPRELPILKLDHLYRMSDETGLLQHARFTTPRYNHGYCVDDNVRGLLLMVLLEQQEVEQQSSAGVDLASRYMAFTSHAFNEEKSQFHNFMSYDRQWLDEVGSEDSQGRAIWALGTVAGRSERRGLCGVANELFERILPAAGSFASPRSWAFALVGIHEYLRRYYGHRLAQNLRVQLAEKLLGLFQAVSRPDWLWFEESLTYANAKIPHALLLSGRWMESNEMLDSALASLDWLCKLQRREDDHFVPIGSNGFYTRGSEPARFDQQPIEAYSTVSACLEAHRVTGDEHWLNEAHRAFEWFLGGNDLGSLLYDPETGGCYDGLQPNAVNYNQGAESTLAFLLSLVEMRLSEHIIVEIQ